MSKTKQPRFGESPLRAIDGTGERIDIHGRVISRRVEYVSPKKLKTNPLNQRFFKELTINELESLVENIRVNGIHDALIAKPDGVLISGHNRLQAAVELELQYVPVRYLQDDLSEEDEVRFMIADNLLRRQLTSEQKIELYRVLYPNFDQRIALRPNATITVINAPIEGSDNVRTEALTPLTAREIAVDTGQTMSAVSKQLHRQNKKNHLSQLEVAASSGNNSIEKIKARQRSIEKDFTSYIKQIEREFSDPDLTAEFRQKKAKKLRELANKIEAAR